MARTRKGDLAEYLSKRNFGKTGEPSGEAEEARQDGPKRFVVQKHSARRLHYDFRLEWEGVLKSWAVTKGPSLDPAERRLAVRTEDHPLSYAEFEGTIPKGEYGGGTVMLWDQGEWEPIDDPGKGLKGGKLSFRLKGRRLKGEWALVRMKAARRGDDKRENWLLIKKDDRYADAEAGDKLLGKKSKSIASKRSMKQIAEQEASGRGGEASSDGIEIEGVRLSNPDKVLYSEQGLTKRDLAEYLLAVADLLLPHLERRPLSLVRCPSGRHDKCFYQRHGGNSLPPAIKTFDIKGEDELFLMIEDRLGLISLAQVGALELHPWNCRVDRLDRPDQLVFDLDPDEGLKFAEVRQAAREVRELLDELGLESFAKLTGGKGVHVVAPIERRHDWDEAKAFAKAVAEELARRVPDRYTASVSKRRRSGRIFVDYLRNQWQATAVAPYSPRARARAPVAVPVDWDELGRIKAPDAYDITTLPRRIRQLRCDPWPGFFDLRQRLRRDAFKRLSG